MPIHIELIFFWVPDEGSVEHSEVVVKLFRIRVSRKQISMVSDLTTNERHMLLKPVRSLLRSKKDRHSW